MLPADMEQLSRLRHTIAKSEALPEEMCALTLGVAEVDAALGGGLTRAALHELSATASLHLGAAAGFALTLALLASDKVKQTLWIATDFGMLESGALYGPGLDLIGLDTERLLAARVVRPVDALFAMEEALKCRALATVIAEINGDIDLTATRRLSLAAREGVKWAWRSPMLARCIRRSRSRMRTNARTARRSKRSPTGATATRHWSGSIRRMG